MQGAKNLGLRLQKHQCSKSVLHISRQAVPLEYHLPLASVHQHNMVPTTRQFYDLPVELQHAILSYVQSPMIRAFPEGFNYPIPRGWPTSTTEGAGGCDRIPLAKSG